MERLENEICSYSNLCVTSATSQLILQSFHRFTYVTAHSPTLPLLHLRHSSFSNPSVSFSNISVISPTSQLILQSFHRFTYVTAHSPILPLFHLRHSSFSNPSFASPTSQAVHLCHLVSRPNCLNTYFSGTVQQLFCHIVKIIYNICV